MMKVKHTWREKRLTKEEDSNGSSDSDNSSVEPSHGEDLTRKGGNEEMS
jgi:hypothetical protein